MIKTTEFQQLLEDGYLEYLRVSHKRKASDNQYARWLGVPSASLNQWINGYRTPNFENALLLSEKLGPRVFETLGYPQVVTTHDERLLYIIRHWHEIDEELQIIIKGHVSEEVQANEQRVKEREEDTS